MKAAMPCIAAFFVSAASCRCLARGSAVRVHSRPTRPWPPHPALPAAPAGCCPPSLPGPDAPLPGWWNPWKNRVARAFSGSSEFTP